MRGESVIESIVMFGAAVWLLSLWFKDYKLHLSGETVRDPLPGAYTTTKGMLMLAAGGAILLLALQTGFEYGLGVSDEQDTLTAWFLLAMIGAAVIEEIIFRGYLVPRNVTSFSLGVFIVSFSLLFAVLHPYLWSFEMPEASYAFWKGEWTWNLDTKGYLSTAFMFINSVWFYALRFMPANVNQSLLPCMVAHLVFNVGVYIVKGAQGFITF